MKRYLVFFGLMAVVAGCQSYTSMKGPLPNTTIHRYAFEDGMAHDALMFLTVKNPKTGAEALMDKWHHGSGGFIPSAMGAGADAVGGSNWGNATEVENNNTTFVKQGKGKGKKKDKDKDDDKDD